LVDLAAQVVEDAVSFLATTGDAQLCGDGAEVVEDAADLDQAIVQLVHRFGVFLAVLVLVELVGRFDVVDVGGRAPACGRGASSAATASLTVASTTARPGRSSAARS
jgi:hypothetical protein